MILFLWTAVPFLIFYNHDSLTVWKLDSGSKYYYRFYSGSASSLLIILQFCNVAHPHLPSKQFSFFRRVCGGYFIPCYSKPSFSAGFACGASWRYRRSPPPAVVPGDGIVLCVGIYDGSCRAISRVVQNYSIEFGTGRLPIATFHRFPNCRVSLRHVESAFRWFFFFRAKWKNHLKMNTQ